MRPSEVARLRREAEESRAALCTAAAFVVGAWEEVRPKLAASLPETLSGGLDRLVEALDTYQAKAAVVRGLEARQAQDYDRRFLLRWQAEHLAAHLHHIAQGVIGWQTDQTSNGRPSEQVVGSTPRPAFTVVRVPAVPELGIPRTALRLWKTEFSRLMEEMEPAVRNAWISYLNRSRHSALYYYDRRNRAVSAVGTADRVLVDWALVLVQIAEPVRPGDGQSLGEIAEALAANGVS